MFGTVAKQLVKFVPYSGGPQESHTLELEWDATDFSVKCHALGEITRQSPIATTVAATRAATLPVSVFLEPRRILE